MTDCCCLKKLSFWFNKSTKIMSSSEQNSNNSDGENVNIKVKVPKRVLHFSDGVLEEYSDDEVDSNSTPPNEEICNKDEIVDPKTLTWGPWLSYKAWAAGSTALSVCDYLGESLASFLGITTPKYWYEIEEFKRMEAERMERQKQAQGWSEPTAGSGDITLDVIKTEQPVSPTPQQSAS